MGMSKFKKLPGEEAALHGVSLTLPLRPSPRGSFRVQGRLSGSRLLIRESSR
jgi:hypothetical protein